MKFEDVKKGMFLTPIPGKVSEGYLANIVEEGGKYLVIDPQSSTSIEMQCTSTGQFFNGMLINYMPFQLPDDDLLEDLIKQK